MITLNELGTITLLGVIVTVLFWIIVIPVFAIEIDMNTIATIESNNNPSAHNKVEDGRGLYQINPICLKEWNNFHQDNKYSKEQLFNSIINAKIAKWYMNIRIPQMIKYYGMPDTIKNRLIAWNAGISYIKNVKDIPLSTKEYIKKYNKLAESIK